MIPMKRWVCLFGTAALLSACGGGGDDSSTPQEVEPAGPGMNTVTTTGPGGLFVGYYQEDPKTDTQDPTAGAFVMNLPASDADFNGSMDYTYAGCQASNVGAISGSKGGLKLAGDWSGVVDKSPQSGSYSGAYNTTTNIYAGTYTNAGGKQFRNLSPCIQYTIAPNGSWELFAIDSVRPAAFSVGITNNAIYWPSTADAASTLVYVLDPTIAKAGQGNPVVWQGTVGTALSVTVPVPLQSGKEYVAVVAVSDAQHARKAFGSRRFVR